MNKSITCKGTLLSNPILMIYSIIMDVIFQRLFSIIILPDILKIKKRHFNAREWQKYGDVVTLKSIYQKFIVRFL